MEMVGTKPSGLAYERFEKQRVKRLGLNEKYSRYYMQKMCCPTSAREVPAYRATRAPDSPMTSSRVPRTSDSCSNLCASPGNAESCSYASTPRSVYNSVQPFATEGKKTCGFGYAESTDNRRKDFGIAPADLPRWRNELGNVSSRSSTVQEQPHLMTAVD